MGFGDIVKRAWEITWRYKVLWVLGIFAGVSGCTSSFGSSGSSNSGGRGGSSRGGSGSDEVLRQVERFSHQLSGMVVTLAIIGAALALIGVVWWLLGIAARAGLVHGVNEAQEGRKVALGEAWSAGFQRWGSVFFLELVLKVPIFVIVLAILVAVIVPIVRLGVTNATESSQVLAALAPICGVLAIGVPLLLVLSYVFGVLYLTALRFIVLDGQSATASLGSAWRAFRERFKDHFLMYLFNWLLNVASSMILSIPLVLIALALIVPAAVGAAATNNLNALWAGIAGMVALMIPLTLLYTGIWGTYTSALWTIFFRRMTGREVLVAAAAPATAVPQPPYAPQPAVPQPPYAPPPQAPQPPYAPPVAPTPPPPAEPPL
jgi:hypothetical protein